MKNRAGHHLLYKAIVKAYMAKDKGCIPTKGLGIEPIIQF